MASGTKSFKLNRCSDWEENGFIENLVFDGDRIISETSKAENGVFISYAFDSMEHETVWHRLKLSADIPQNALMRVWVYSSDNLYMNLPYSDEKGETKLFLDSYFSDETIATSKKIEVFKYLGAEVHENPSDLLLFGYSGRYLWICIELINYGKENIVLNEAKIEFPRVSFVDYLPQIYRGGVQKDTFLARYIGVFQSIYLDLQEKIDDAPLNFDPKMTDPQILEWLADWFSIEDDIIWGEERLRVILKNAVRLYKLKGTKRAVSEMVKIYAGVDPIIVEQFDVLDNQFYENSKKHVENLYGKDGYIFSVIISSEYIKAADSYAELMKLINRFKPIDTECNLVILNDNIYLDHHCYLGVNSYVAQNQSLVLDEGSQSGDGVLLLNN